MPTRFQSTTPFKEGQQTNAHGKDAPKTPVFSDRSKSARSPGSDPLKKALGGYPPELPKRFHMGDTMRKVSPKGANYNPAGEFGRLRGKPTPPTRYGSHFNRNGKNAVGHNSNRTGEKSGYRSFRPSGGGRNV